MSLCLKRYRRFEMDQSEVCVDCEILQYSINYNYNLKKKHREEGY